MDFLQEQVVDPFNKVLYTYIFIYLLIGAGIYFTVRTRFVQVRYFGRMLRQLRRSRRRDGGVSSFQAFCVGLAARVGTGTSPVSLSRSLSVVPARSSGCGWWPRSAWRRR